MQPVSGIRLFGIRLGILLLAAYWCVIFTGTHLPPMPTAMPKYNDKLAHFSAFFGLAMLLCYCTNSKKLARRFATIAIICVVYGAIDEWTQSFVRGRQTDLKDLFADTIGTVAAIAVYAIGRMVWARRKRGLMSLTKPSNSGRHSCIH
ncbi:VanZ family protein [Neorhodopirellula pilleata]|uniref:VanZ like family protein n=1 Tax=Neorhodopirellula pilleata TaxID=2714738 RepID=A0A5C6A4B6_9BACT|nr:VanZ family protein [Neorhodopirellula pilleata]TWT94235.1 VanZ like family protein [Neorhodopirellula pilleata]